METKPSMNDRNPEIYYEKTYCDDTGRKANDVFSKNPPEFIAYRKIWQGVIDGFSVCTNSDLIFFCTDGNIRIIIATETPDNTYSFGQYFMSELDGKVLTLAEGTIFAIQNMDEGKSAYMLGYFEEEPQFRYFSKNIFDWKKKSA